MLKISQIKFFMAIFFVLIDFLYYLFEYNDVLYKRGEYYGY